MIDLFTNQIKLEKGDMDRLEGKLREFFDSMYLKFDSENINTNIFSMMKNMEVDYVVRNFNNRVFSLRVNYALAKKYLEKGIPDEPYFQSPGIDGKGVSYFPLFQEEHYGNYYWYGFYIESLYFRIEGVVDSLYHIINSYFDLNISPNLGFQGKIREALSSREESLENSLKKLSKNKIYIKSKRIRNDITHNFNPNSLSSGIDIKRNHEGKIMFAAQGIPDYMNVSEIQENIENLISLLASVVKEVQQYVV